MKKRKWIYCQKPNVYGIFCDRCGQEVEWSEYEEQVFCPKCQLDTRGTESIFSGPIPVEACLMLGISFDRIDLETGKIMYMAIEKDRIIWSFSSAKNINVK